ncbi:hypothetical protein H7I87_00445 [Mycobacterium timonense]|uniref:Uncharacterized protein n=3 Tax=Mycobacterium avium complex (MAC) TaxID=120793 RepID=A0AAW5S1E8_MYCBC|nr:MULTISPECIES: hypothetical protein [Mycobacterium avium complex (MAC)]MCV6988687.1 hypothetical protein [Mycobacterium bouchedurhonense]MCV6993235.1 hypothetical protein [Mycobacterium timonense]ORA45521.1 hypothetical protein BST19_20085 [Mycobacterium bouchedurhonense]ORB77230.1 hypothetical protein BST46_25705 [Mycobacterium timonense]
MADTVIEIDPSELSPMQREVNRGLMVAFINAGLLHRAHLDVRRSIVLYDESATFAYATDELPSDNQLKALYESSGVRYWSRGC